MNRKPRRILIIILLFVAIIVMATLSYRYIPFNKLFKVKGADETMFQSSPMNRTQPPNTLFFDFEVAPGTELSENLYTQLAHSGKSCSKTFGKNSYSISFERTAEEIGLENLRSVSMSAWVYLYPGSSEPLASLVFAASNKKINVAWKGVTIKGQDIPRGKWFKITGFFDLSGIEFKPDYRLEFYFWNNSDNDFLVDDIFIAFTGPDERPGDSSLVDLTRSAYSPRFNFPPFPFEYLERQETGNKQSACLVMSGATREGDINPYHTILSGPFINPDRKVDDLLVTDNLGNIELFSFCREKKEFRKINPVISPAVKSLLTESRILAGSFSAPGKTELLLVGKKGGALGTFDHLRTGCPENGSRVAFSVTDQSSVNPFQDADTLVTGDFMGLKLQQVLALNKDGSWILFRYVRGSAGLFTMLARGLAPVPGWNSGETEIRLTSGHFLKNYPTDMILSVFRDRQTGKRGYALMRFDRTAMQFAPYPSGIGKTIGLDTLQTKDDLIPAPDLSPGTPTWLRYSQDKRFDLKRIFFTDTTFCVRSNLDFRGYDHDFNPKYFEVLRIVSGQFLEPGRLDFLVIGKNSSLHDKKTGIGNSFINRKDLPNTIQVYGLEKGTDK